MFLSSNVNEQLNYKRGEKIIPTSHKRAEKQQKDYPTSILILFEHSPKKQLKVLKTLQTVIMHLASLLIDTDLAWLTFME